MSKINHRELKPEGKFSIVKASGCKTMYHVYDEDDNIQNVFKTLKEAREWAKMMSK